MWKPEHRRAADRLDNFSKRYLEPGLAAKSIRDQPNYAAPAPSSVQTEILLPPRT